MSEFTGDMTSAVESAFAAASTPDASTTTTTETAPASATETPAVDVSQPAAPPTETATTPEPGPIPYPRFKEVNDKWTTASKELESLGWAKGVNPQLAQSAIQLLTRAQQNPLAFTEELETLRDHPVLGPQLRSWAARTLGFRNAPRQDAPVTETMPEPDLVFEDGRKAYSAEAQAKRDQFLLKQWESKIDERIEPLAKKTAANDQYVANQVWEGIQSKATVDAKTEIDTLSQQYPQFNEHRKEIASVMEANPTFTLKQAWAQVFVDKVGPQLAGQQAAAVKAKVSAGSANPARPSGAPPGPPQDFEEALRQLYPNRT
jgi:hypothetical protein